MLRPAGAGLLVVAVLAATASTAGGTSAETQAVTLLRRKCVNCHGPAVQQGGLRSDSRAGLLRGGAGGPAFAPGKPEALLLTRVQAPAGQGKMPVGGPPLTREEVGLLARWLRGGAAWPVAAAEETWWSFRPVQASAPPRIDGPDVARVRNPIDPFILRKLREKGLRPAAEAGRRTLIRRVTYDLTGLPPTPEEVEAFLADEAPQAYERLVDRLLASPRFGERWARHWLDVVHFGESHGYDKDKPRPHAWPYRDYVIRAFNEDRPYARFLQEQIAGDVLFPGSTDGIEALGFIAAGPWDFIGHAEVPESKIDGKVARHLDRDDMVSNTIGVFNSLTVHCAQCHDHKFDPVPQSDYYRLQAVFAAVDRTDRLYDRDPAVAARRAAIQARLAAAEAARDRASADLARAGGPELARLDARLAELGRGGPVRPVEHGYHSAIEPRSGATKWVQVDLGGPVSPARVVLNPCYDDFAGIGAGFGFPVRFRIELSDDPVFREGVRTVADLGSADTPNPGLTAREFPASGQSGRYVRVTATRLAHRQTDHIFALAELQVLDESGRNLAAGRPVTALDSIEAGPRWGTRNLTDGRYPASGGGPLVAAVQVERRALLRSRSPAALEESDRREQEVAGLRAETAALPAPSLVYAGGIHRGTGSFTGTGAAGGKPRSIFLLARGDVTKPGAEVTPGALSAVQGPVERFDSLAGGEGERRAALARWLSDPRHPLTWRSIVNRVWGYHFGQGLVATSNDFGKMGALPTHPELLDWLSAGLAGLAPNPHLRPGSLKSLHRLIVTSATYRQSATGDPKGPRLDSGNTLLGRMTRRKLEAEAVRDAVLAISGKLDLTMGGPSFQDFVIEKPEHSPHYQYHLHDPADPRSHRRSVYRFAVRSQQQPFMSALDCADPSLSVPRRNQTLAPQQALALLNDDLMLVMARFMAERLERFPGTTADRIARAVTLAFGRPARPAELRMLTAHAEKHGLPGVCRLLFNLNEFHFVD